MSLNKYSMKKELLFHLSNNDPTLKLFDPYVNIWVLPPRRTITGKYNQKICFTIGRDFNENKARDFFSKCSKCKSEIDLKTQKKCPKCGDDFEKKVHIAEQWSREVKVLTPNELIEATKVGTVKNMLIKAGVFVAEKMDIELPELVVKKKPHVSYEMFKTDNVSEIASFIYGASKALGRAIKLFGLEKNYEDWSKLIKENVEIGLKLGFEGKKELYE